MSLPPPTGLPQPPTPQRTHCYRHPDREAGRRCTRCGRPACNECLVRADIGSQCVECARRGRPAASTRARDWSARQPILVTYTLIVMNLGVFAWMVAQDPRNLSPGNRLTQEQIDLGLNEQLVAITDEWYRLVSSAFLHFGIFHLALNMLLLFQLGLLLEPTLGRIRFSLLYIASMLGGSAGVLLLHPNDRGIHGGASGAVFGLLGAAAVIMFRRGINPLSTGIGTTIALNLFITFTIPGISIGGHVGGLVAGAAAGSLMAAPRYGRQPEWVSYLAPVAVSVIAIVVSMVVTSP
jgi:membrane associated rhomboid family serine protease